MKSFLTILLVIGISSTAHAVELNTAKDLLAQTIKDAGAVSSVNNNLKVDLVKGEAMLKDASEPLTVTKMEFDTQRGTFNAYISSNNNLPFEVAGTFAETTKVPALNRRLDKNEVIAKNDIMYLDLETSKLRTAYIIAEDRLIGRTPTRAIFKERPITENQVADAKVVTKNAQIALQYKNHSLTIATNGIAMEDGAVGQSVRFKNANSNRIVRAKIINEGLAVVQANSEVASN